VVGALDPLADGQQGGKLITSTGRIPRSADPVGEGMAGVEGIRVLKTLDPLADRQQGGKLITSLGGIPRLTGPPSERMAGV